MPHFTLQVDKHGPILLALVTPSAPRIQALADAKQPAPPPVRIRALVDTGASHTCVDPSVMKALGLTPTGKTQMHTPSTEGTPHLADQYDVALIIPGSNAEQAPLRFESISVAACQFDVQIFAALIGRDILSHCILHYNGDAGFFSLCY